MVNPKDIIIYRGEREWSALYHEGKLLRVGDHYLIEEHLLDMLGIEVRNTEDFMRGGSYREDAGQTIKVVEAYTAQKKRDLLAAEAIDTQIEELRAEAERLRTRKHEEA